MPIPERAREVIRRLEAGEDPVRINEEFGDLWVSEDSPFVEGAPLKGRFGQLTAPRVDETLHDLYRPPRFQVSHRPRGRYVAVAFFRIADSE